MVRENSLRGRVILEREGNLNWSLKKTIEVCIEENNKFEKEGSNPAPKFRKAIKAEDRPYIQRWVLGCHFSWINPREKIKTAGQ